MTKVLIVDDDPDLVEACRIFLADSGFEVVSENNRYAGLRAVQLVDPDLLILDVMMDQPDDGIAMAQDLRKKGFKKPILMLTSVNRVTGMTIGIDRDVLPVDAFLEKPVSPKDLLDKVNRLLAGKK